MPKIQAGSRASRINTDLASCPFHRPTILSDNHGYFLVTWRISTLSPTLDVCRFQDNQRLIRCGRIPAVAKMHPVDGLLSTFLSQILARYLRINERHAQVRTHNPAAIDWLHAARGWKKKILTFPNGNYAIKPVDPVTNK